MSAKERHYCPNCGYDYEQWVEICPDCGGLIETVDESRRLEGVRASLDEFGPDEDPRWTVVTNAPNAIIGTLLKSQLEDAGIPVLIRRSPSADIAQFSGNDFVPQDLLVPESKEAEARSLLTSNPDRGASAPYWGSAYGSDSYDGYDDWDEDEDDTREEELEQLRGLWDTGSTTEDERRLGEKLPEGWTLLPTERDVRARAQHQRTHGDGWGVRGQGSGVGDQGGTEPAKAVQWQTRSDYEYSQPVSPRPRRSERADYDEPGWNGTPRWIRIFYGILLLAISLPFLFQLFEQVLSFLSW